MIQRQRHTPDSGAPLGQGVPPRAPAATALPAVWEEWYQRASPAQQQELVALAQRQGILYTFQLPAPDSTVVAPPRPLLGALLNGQLHDLEPHRPPAVDVADSDLDTGQRQAVSLALSTPDIGLIQGYPGTGKSRTIAEILRQAARRGQRVLFLAPGAAALDRVLERIGSDSGLLAIRCLAADETPETLAPCIRGLSLPQRIHRFREETLPAAQQALAAARAACERYRAHQGAWARLEELAGEAERLAQRCRDIEARRANLSAVVEAELEAAPTAKDLSALQQAWLGHLRSHADVVVDLDARLGRLCEQLDAARKQTEEIEASLQPLRPVAEALRGRRWWSPRWWQGLFRGNVLTRFEELERTAQERAAARAKLQQDLQDLETARSRTETALGQQRRQLVEAECTRRGSDVDDALASLQIERQRFEEAWRQACFAVGPEAPAEARAAVVGAARQRQAARLAEAERAESVARHWAEGVEHAAATLGCQMTRCAHIVAAPTAALAGEAAALEGDGGAPPFDLLILDEAERVTESEFLSAARRARRWVLVGEPAVLEEAGAASVLPAPQRLRPGFFHRLWERLHADPRRLPYAWSRREEHLVCTLRRIPAGQEGALEREPVADRPDVELRILVPPRPGRGAAPGEPLVAEIVFPVETPIVEAKEFIYRELQELPIQSHCPCGRWQETAARLILRLDHGSESGPEIALGEGIFERLVAGSAYTASLEFDRVSGWTRERAEAWVAERLGLRDPGRTVVLKTMHRPTPALGAFLSELLFAGACEPAAPATADGASVEFVAVPPGPAPGEDWRAPPARSPANGPAVSVRAPRRRASKGGAGLEVDLADTRPLEHVPPEVRACLPREGLVNYLEARAVVSRLEALLGETDFVACGLRWQGEQESRCGCAGTQAGATRPAAHCPTIAVMALYAAQAELLRLLLSRSPLVARSPLRIEVGLPSAFRHCDCLAALVSLTRSHTHRAVSFGDGPAALAEALTRPVDRLILFGDPGTLARRSQWQGAVDHLDERAAGAERRLIDQLVACLQGPRTWASGVLVLAASEGAAPGAAVEGAAP